MINLFLQDKITKSTGHEYLEVVHEGAFAGFDFVDAEGEQALADEGEEGHQEQNEQFGQRGDTWGLGLDKKRNKGEREIRKFIFSVF